MAVKVNLRSEIGRFGAIVRGGGCPDAPGVAGVCATVCGVCTGVCGVRGTVGCVGVCGVWGVGCGGVVLPPRQQRHYKSTSLIRNRWVGVPDRAFSTDWCSARTSSRTAEWSGSTASVQGYLAHKKQGYLAHKKQGYLAHKKQGYLAHKQLFQDCRVQRLHCLCRSWGFL